MDGMVVEPARKTKAIERIRLDVRGIVQGVGYRPLVYRLAVENRLTGHVRNRSGEVAIEVEGRPENIASFMEQLVRLSVEPARIDQLSVSRLSPVGDREFVIEASEHADRQYTTFPADLAVCANCLLETLRPDSRFHLYPFTSCTYCGPRYSVIRSLPYDRPHTSFAPFSLCKTCLSEYSDPMNRRFHAQTIACKECGPQIKWISGQCTAETDDWLSKASAALEEGKILAVKGIGGFHLLCDAARRETVGRLRERKRRPRKPLAVMARGMEEVEEHFLLSDSERRILASRQAPILLLRPKESAGRVLALDSIAPGLTRIGVMLAYTPLHRLLFGKRFHFLVATSGNRSGFPIAASNEEAWSQLRGMADAFLVHDREIVIRIDDSVGHVVEDELCLIRRARGYVPDWVEFPHPDREKAMEIEEAFPDVLGAGGDMKNAFCFIHREKALLSQHLGDMENMESIAHFRVALNHIEKILGRKAELVAYDPHPEYRISEEAKKLSREAVPVYHHHSHMAACMAENGLVSQVIGCILDGTGFGRDGHLWGFEILAGDYTEFERMFHLRPILLPGGEAAIRHPWMTGLSLIYEAVQDPAKTMEWGKRLFPRMEEKWPMVRACLEGKIKAPRASSAGRLFDGVSAILGLCTESTYEGEAAMLLSERIEGLDMTECFGQDDTGYPFDIKDGQWLIDGLIRHMLLDLEQSVPIEIINLKFHHTLAEMVRAGVRQTSQKTGLRTVVLSGGVWNNRYLLSSAKKRLQQDGFSVYTHKKVPAGDGGIAFGQAVSALWRWHKNHVSVGAGQSH